jgi:DNA polymerase-3 subunit beta
MEFTIKQNVLKDELGYVNGIVEKKSTIPVLSNILIESVGENSIRILGTDLDVTIRCEAEADIKQSGSMCIQARKLFDIVRLLDNGDVHFKKEENEWVSLNCGKSKFKLAGVSREQFPEVPEFKSVPRKISAEIFNHFIQNTAFAITNEQSRFTLSGAKFVIENGTARMVTTDGHRLAFIERKLNNSGDEPMDSLIPKKALMELTKISKDAKGDISFGEDPNHIYFEVDGRLLITRKLSGTFPNYEMVIPKDNDKTVTFDAEEMRNAIRRVALMADERTRSVRITIKPNEIEIGAQSSEEGEAQERVTADYSGEEVSIGFNSQYLQDFLNIVGVGAETEAAASGVAETENEGEKVRVKETSNRPRVAFEFKDGNGQTQMKVAGDTNYDYKYIVMPLRI